MQYAVNGVADPAFTPAATPGAMMRRLAPLRPVYVFGAVFVTSSWNQLSAAGMAERTFALAAAVTALSLKLRYAGTAIATRMPRMMMTTRSSMRVKPCSLARRDLILVITFLFSAVR